MTRRVISAFLLSPAIVPLGVAVWAVVHDVHVQEGVILGSIYAAFTYGAAVILGIPAFYYFSRRGWTRWWQYAVAGAAIGACVLAAASIVAGESFSRPSIALTFLVTGAVSTTVFWLIAGPPRWKWRGPAGAAKPRER